MADKPGVMPGSEPVPPPTAPAAKTELRRGVVTLPQTIAQSLSTMAPAMSGAFITYLAAVKAGGATPLSFLFALVACLFIGGVVAQFALHLPSAGSSTPTRAGASARSGDSSPDGATPSASPGPAWPCWPAAAPTSAW